MFSCYDFGGIPMKYIQKTPEIIEAIRFTDESKDKIIKWAQNFNFSILRAGYEKGNPVMKTLDGCKLVRIGDFVCKGSRDNFFVLSEEELREQYEGTFE